MSRGRFTVGDGYAEYRGPTVAGSVHRHAAFQIVIAPADHTDVGMVDAAGREHRGAALVVPPMVPHRLLPAPDLLTVYIEPHSALADDLRNRYRDGIAVAGETRDSIAAASETHDAIVAAFEVRDIGAGKSRSLDARLLRAMRLLLERSISMPELAAEVGLSPQRLRALARQQIGMPLPRWRLWSELRRAAEALQSGQSPAEAAITAGFADQAHLTRRMREMVGLTPASVLPVLRNQAPSAP
ncbi:helix-turn-helix domain-containing protein [Actinoplanes sp. HUAS TT8]|uniref:AraC family transcriptional regulator n=1 Tax=Actinoplanes sp. HUAS TT8 TaxID=3447453 RepID=UPI003F521553